MKPTPQFRSVLALIVCVALAVCSFEAIARYSISELYLALMLPLSVIVPCVFIYPDPVAYLKVLSFEVKLRKLEEKEKELKDLAHRVADLVEAATDGALVTHEHDPAKFKKALARVREL